MGVEKNSSKKVAKAAKAAKKAKKEKKEKKVKAEVGGEGGSSEKAAETHTAAAAAADDEATYEDKVKAVNIISTPLASKKVAKKVHKLVKKASGAKWMRRGVKEVVKGLRKGEKGLGVIAGDIYPIDVVSHLPILFEEAEVPYIFVPSKADLGAAASTKRPTSVVLLRTPKETFDNMDLYKDVEQAIISEGK